MAAVSSSVRAVVHERDGGRCAHCGTARGLTVQHRRNRGMGGSRTRDGYANLLLLCAESNVGMEQDAVRASAAEERGWKIPQSDPREPWQIPVWFAHDGWRWLLDDGNYRFSPPPPAGEAD